MIRLHERIVPEAGIRGGNCTRGPVDSWAEAWEEVSRWCQRLFRPALMEGGARSRYEVGESAMVSRREHAGEVMLADSCILVSKG